MQRLRFTAEAQNRPRRALIRDDEVILSEILDLRVVLADIHIHSDHGNARPKDRSRARPLGRIRLRCGRWLLLGRAGQ